MTLKAVDGIQLNQKKVRSEYVNILIQKGLHTNVTAAYTSLYYYTGFAYLMTRRYQDSIKTLSSVLLYLSRMKQYHTRQYDQVNITGKLPF